MKSRAALGDRGIDCENATVEGCQDVTIEPRPKYRALRRVTAFSQQHADFQFLDGNRR